MKRIKGAIEPRYDKRRRTWRDVWIGHWAKWVKARNKGRKP